MSRLFARPAFPLLVPETPRPLRWWLASVVVLLCLAEESPSREHPPAR